MANDLALAIMQMALEEERKKQMNMAAMDVASRIEKMIQEDEGGWKFTDRADDAGGPTYGGMTWVKFNEWQQNTQPQNDWFTQAEFINHAQQDSHILRVAIYECYCDEFWRKGHVAEVPEFARDMYFSACVNMGLKEALKCLQMAYNDMCNTNKGHLLVDGHWGPKTAEALGRFSDAVAEDEMDGNEFHFADKFKLAFSDAVMHRYIRIVQRNAREWRDYARRSTNVPPKVLQTENLMGWFNRAVAYRSK